MKEVIRIDIESSEQPSEIVSPETEAIAKWSILGGVYTSPHESDVQGHDKLPYEERFVFIATRALELGGKIVSEQDISDRYLSLIYESNRTLSRDRAEEVSAEMGKVALDDVVREHVVDMVNQGAKLAMLAKENYPLSQKVERLAEELATNNVAALEEIEQMYKKDLIGNVTKRGARMIIISMIAKQKGIELPSLLNPV